MFGFGLLTTACLMLNSGGALGVEPGPALPIVGGNEAGPCEFPFTVSILEDDATPVMCTGTLVNPNVVTLAAHCINPKRPVIGVGFGEEGQGETGPQRVVGVEDCVGHPDYFVTGFPDVAYCTLEEAVEDVAIMPILAGCEADLLEPGVEVTIVGFGASYGNFDTGELETQGVGLKRYTTQTIDVVDVIDEEVDLLGPMGSQSACFGDSGGPALIELPDGTWRVLGAASRLYDPGGFPPPDQPGNICGVGVTYGLLTPVLPWLEAETGYDLTPCHDDAGLWDPGAGCGDFPIEPQLGAGTWDNGCVGGAVGGGAPVCEPAAGTSSSGGESSTGDASSTGRSGDDSSTGRPGTTTGFGVGTGGSTDDAPSGTSTGMPVGDSDSGRPPEPPTTEASSDSSGSADEDAAGCGCVQGQGRPSVLWLGVGLLGLRRRR